MRLSVVCLIVLAAATPIGSAVRAEGPAGLSQQARAALTEIVIQCRRLLLAAQDGIVPEEYQDPCREASDRWYLVPDTPKGTRLQEDVAWLYMVERVNARTAGVYIRMGDAAKADQSAFSAMAARLSSIEAALR